MDRDRSHSRFITGIDIETTGLEPESAEIIEVAAIRYDERGQEVARFEQLCSSRAPIPSFVTSLTGISADMVAGQPRFSEICEKLGAFIGSDTVFAHNAPFDISFLKYHGLELSNPVWDTFTLASTAYPSLSSYNLGSLQRFLELPSKANHRAAGDIEVAHQLLLKLRTALGVSASASASIMSILAKTGQEHYAELFTLSDPPPAAPAVASSRRLDKGRLGGVSAILAHGGILEKNLPGFIVRPEQITMAEAVEKTLREKTVSLIEAGTGTGKTYAYLVPILEYLSEQKGQVFIATYSKYLQDQLIQNDLPRLQKILQTFYPVASLKGRSNYICSRRLAALAQKGSFPATEGWVLIKLLRWLDQGGSGDIEEINLSHQPFRFIQRCNADSAICSRLCSAKTCVYKKARENAQKARIVVINHALLLQMKNADPSIPLCIDEAHHLPEAARTASQIDFSPELVSELLHAVSEAFSHVSQKSNQDHIATLHTEITAGWEELLESVALFMLSRGKNRKFLLTKETRGTSGWKKIHAHGADVAQRLHFLHGLSEGLRHTLSAENALVADDALQDLKRFIDHFTAFLEGSEARIQWLEVRTYHNNTAGILGDMDRDVAPAIQNIFGQSRAVILTSATLTTAQDFSFIKRSLGVSASTDLPLGASFSYREQMMIYIVEDSPLPSSALFDRYSAGIIQQISMLLGGKTLGLFTSYSAVNAVFSAINSELHKENIKLLASGMTGGRSQMVERFKGDEKTTLLGTSTFWEGLDVPGTALSAVVIPKLPFTPPDDPLLQTARNASGSAAFEKIALPHMLLRLRQGLGRLIRTTTDRGVVVLLDSRILTASYRETLLKSLPPATIRIGSKKELIPNIAAWLHI